MKRADSDLNEIHTVVFGRILTSFNKCKQHGAIWTFVI